MYEKKVPYKDYKGGPRTENHFFMLETRDVFKLMVELKAMYEWQESIKDVAVREVPTEQVVEFYNNLEAVLLASWGIPSEDGKYFRRGGRYDFEDSKAFATIMHEFVMDPPEGTKLLDGIMPDGMEDMIKKADDVQAAETARLAKAGDQKDPEELEREIQTLRNQLAQGTVAGSAENPTS